VSDTTPRRIKKRVVVPALILLLLFGTGARVVIKGSWADDAAHDPTSSADGIVRQLVLENGRKVPRIAVVIDRPVEEVWAAITSYDHFSEIFPDMAGAKGEREADGRWHFTGTATTLVGSWPIDVKITHAHEGATYRASWDDASRPFAVNRGSWTVSPVGTGSTLVVYSLDAEIPGYPAFAIRYAILHRSKTALRDLRAWIERQHRGA
jgi:uncharacterized protein YndB with AHSA1/START domain